MYQFNAPASDHVYEIELTFTLESIGMKVQKVLPRKLQHPHPLILL
jgi:hypothetical protein